MIRKTRRAILKKLLHNPDSIKDAVARAFGRYFIQNPDIRVKRGESIVWIVHRDTKGTGQVVDVFDSKEKAKAYRDRCLAGKERRWTNEAPEHWMLEEWRVR